MLVITKNQANQLCISANEKATLVNPVYLFIFKQKEQNVNIPVILTNISSYGRYDLFSFTEGTDAVLTYTGEYVLTVYEQVSAVNTDPDLALGVVHIEQCLVLKEPFIVKIYEPTITRNIYEFS